MKKSISIAAMTVAGAGSLFNGGGEVLTAPQSEAIETTIDMPAHDLAASVVVDLGLNEADTTPISVPEGEIGDAVTIENEDAATTTAPTELEDESGETTISGTTTLPVNSKWWVGKDGLTDHSVTGPFSIPEGANVTIDLSTWDNRENLDDPRNAHEFQDSERVKVDLNCAGGSLAWSGASEDLADDVKDAYGGVFADIIAPCDIEMATVSHLPNGTQYDSVAVGTLAAYWELPQAPETTTTTTEASTTTTTVIETTTTTEAPTTTTTTEAEVVITVPTTETITTTTAVEEEKREETEELARTGLTSNLAIVGTAAIVLGSMFNAVGTRLSGGSNYTPRGGGRPMGGGGQQMNPNSDLAKGPFEGENEDGEDDEPTKKSRRRRLLRRQFPLTTCDLKGVGSHRADALFLSPTMR